MFLNFLVYLRYFGFWFLSLKRKSKCRVGNLIEHDLEQNSASPLCKRYLFLFWKYNCIIKLFTFLSQNIITLIITLLRDGYPWSPLGGQIIDYWLHKSFISEKQKVVNTQFFQIEHGINFSILEFYIKIQYEFIKYSLYLKWIVFLNKNYFKL